MNAIVLSDFVRNWDAQDGSLLSLKGRSLIFHALSGEHDVAQSLLGELHLLRGRFPVLRLFVTLPLDLCPCIKSDRLCMLVILSIPSPLLAYSLNQRSAALNGLICRHLKSCCNACLSDVICTIP